MNYILTPNLQRAALRQSLEEEASAEEQADSSRVYSKYLRLNYRNFTITLNLAIAFFTATFSC